MQLHTLFYVGLLVLAVRGLQLQEISYNIHSVQIDSDYSFSAVIFTFQFDENITLVSTSDNSKTYSQLTLPLPSTADSPGYCFPPFACTDPYLFAVYLGAIIRLECPSETIYSYAQSSTAYDGVSPMEYFGIFPGSSEPLLNFFSRIGFMPNSYQSAIDETKIFGFMLLSYNIEGAPYAFAGKVRTVDADLAAGTCSFVFDDQNSPLYHFTGVGDSSSFSGSYNNIKKETLSCSYYDSLQISRDISNTITNMSTAADFSTLQNLQFQNSLLVSSDALTACIDVIEQYVTQKVESYPIDNTTACLREGTDPAYSSDPCCNLTLQYEQCCAPASKTLQLTVLDNVNVAQLQCKTDIQSTALLADYIINTNNAQDPVDGCQAVTSRIVNDQTVEHYTDFIESCLVDYYGQNYIGVSLVACTTDADCLTYCDTFAGYCYIDWLNPDPDMVNCHVSRMDPTVMQLLKREWDLPQNISLDDFKTEYFNNLNSPNCVGLFGFVLLQWNSNQVWTSDPTNQPVCSALATCNYDYTLGVKDCDTTGYKCVYNLFGFNFTIFYPEYCVLENIGSTDDCTAAGGVWDDSLQPWPCTFPSATSKDLCLPTSICPADNPADYFVHTQCSSAFCYMPNVSQAECQPQCNTSAILSWNPNSVDGGFCQVIGADKATCLSANATWWSGRSWSDGHYATEEECNEGTCLIQTTQYLGIKPTDCSQQYGCTKTCRACASTIGVSLCYSTTMDSCDCAISGGIYNTKYNICELNLGKSSCVAQNHTYLSCIDLNKDQCDACANGTSCPQYYDILECQFAVGGTCPDEDSCLNLGGLCSDPYTSRNVNCSFNAEFLASPDCGGVCLYPLTPESGKWDCPSSIKDFSDSQACISGSIFTKTECENTPGHYWQETFYTKSDCLEPTACNIGGNFNLQDADQCQSCNGEVTSLYTWSPGEYFHGTQHQLNWIKAEFTQNSFWKPTLDFNKVSAIVNKVIVQQYTDAFQTESKCLYNPLLEVINHIICDCTVSPDPNNPNPAVCYNDGTRVTSVGVQRFYAGVADSIKASSVQVTVYEDTIQANVPYVDIDIDVISASQFRTEKTLSINVLSSSLDQNPYAIIKNSHNAVVGQLMGDGIVLDFIPYGFNSSADSASEGDPNFEFQRPLQACVQLRRDIPHSQSDFPIPDFAVASSDFKQWTPLETTVNQTAAGYCLMLTKSGNYFPILRTADWATRTKGKFIDDNVVEAFIYIFGVIFILFSFVSAFQMYVGALSMVGLRLNLAVVLFFFMFMFNMVRGLYLLILPSGRLEHNLGGKYFLSEAPQFFFFSVYSTIIFLWAELSIVIAHKPSFLYHFKWPFIFTNIGLYTLFVVVVAVYQSVNPDRQDKLKKAYVYILAGACIAAVIAFNVFGKKLITIQYRASKTKTMGDNSQLKRMVITLVMSSLAILAQIAFLFVVTYDTVSPKIALVAYVLTEIIPSATLLYTLRPLSRKVLKQATTTSTTNAHPGTTTAGSGSGSKGSTTHENTHSNSINLSPSSSASNLSYSASESIMSHSTNAV